MNEELKKTVRAVQGMEQYDESVKQVLAHKIILANILVNTVKDFKEMKPEEAEIGVTPQMFLWDILPQ